MVDYVPLSKEKTYAKNYKDLNISIKYKSAITCILNTLLSAENKSKITKILLFGSCAREETKCGSDVDILVVTSDKISDTLVAEWRKYILDNVVDVDVDIIFYTSKMLSEGQTAFTKNIRKESIVLYEW